MLKDFAGFCCTIIRCVNLFQALRSPRAGSCLTNLGSHIYQSLIYSQVCKANTLTLAHVFCTIVTGSFGLPSQCREKNFLLSQVVLINTGGGRTDNA